MTDKKKKEKIMTEYETALKEKVEPQVIAGIHASCKASKDLEEYDACATPKLKEAIKEKKKEYFK